MILLTYYSAFLAPKHYLARNIKWQEKKKFSEMSSVPSDTTSKQLDDAR